MSELLRAIDTSSQAGLAEALEIASARGNTSTAETLLGALSERFPSSVYDAATRAATAAVAERQWGVVSYLADFLTDTRRAVGGAPRLHDNRATEHVEQEMLRCLRDHAKESPDKPFRLTDAIEDVCVRRGIDFAVKVATVDCAADGVAPQDRLECAQKAVNADPAFIEFEYSDPELPPEWYGGTENPARCFSLSNPSFSARHLRGAADRVTALNTIAIKISAPPQLSGVYEIESDGSREGVARAVAAKFQDLYDQVGAEPPRDLSELDLAGLRRDAKVYTVVLAEDLGLL